MSLADQIRKQEERRKELAGRLHDLGREFAEYVRKFGLVTLPIMDATGEITREMGSGSWDSDPKEYRIPHCAPTRISAFPLNGGYFLQSPAFEPITSHAWGCIAITTDGEVLFTEALAYDPRAGVGYRNLISGFTFDGPHKTEALVCREAYTMKNLELSSWRQLRETEQHNQLLRLSEEAHVHGLPYVIEPIELAMLKIYNSAQRR
jgi:hypothetical protein